MKSKMLVCLVVAVCILAGTCFAVNTYHQCRRIVVRPGDTFSVPICAMTDVDIKGYSVALSFDPDDLELLDCTLDGTRGAGPLMPPNMNIDNVLGTLKFGVIWHQNCDTSSVVAGDGPILVAQFRVRPTTRHYQTCLTFRDIDLAKNRLTPCGGGSVTPGCEQICIRIKAKVSEGAVVPE